MMCKKQEQFVTFARHQYIVPLFGMFGRYSTK